MYNILITSLKQTLKLFASSFFCSALFVYFYDATYSRPLMGFLLLLASMLLFTFICDKFFFSLCDKSEHFADYFIPSGIAFAIYVIVAYSVYFLNLDIVYNLLFLPTRFIAPLYPERISYVISYIIMALMMLRIPITKYYDMKTELREYMSEGSMPLPFHVILMNALSDIVHSLSNVLKYTVLLFAASTLCSIVFINFFEIIYDKPLIYVAVISASLIIFLFICDRLFFHLCGYTETTLEHFIPSIVAFITYVTVASLVFKFCNVSLFDWFFLPTRFIAPILPSNISFISCIISFVLLFGIILRISLERYFYIKQLQDDEEFRMENLSPLELDEDII